ncbi:solute carrier family 25 member 47-A isoform X2 [Notothenia coriiceps]|uniref:Solute carrier family 25 member 47-A isoform X2 n=1 Tax=Notothenia coriiceps TaxID=8208 RepID=A0A6I9NUZ6_9TELE|nr:PREDICTED: solute carrier family 25 member 47 isoform X2 [Notothenia coriiceps]
MHIKDFVSGSLAGACGVAVGYPLDTVKVRIQTQKQFTGIWQCAAETFSKEGVHGFFKGLSLPITTISMTSSVVFGTYRNCLQCLSQARGGGPNTKPEVFLSGMLAGIAQTSVMSPGDIVKVRLQCQTESKRGGTNMPKPSLGCCDAGRWNIRNGRLDFRNAHGRDQSPAAGGWGAGDEALQGLHPLHH